MNTTATSRLPLILRARRARRLLAAAVATGLLAAALPAAAASAAAALPTEYEVKAAFLYNFAKFVKWPDAAQGRGPGPLVITVLGHDPFGEAWKVLAGKTVEGRAIAVSRAARVDDVLPTEILFIGPGQHRLLEAALATVHGKPVLTVGDTPGYAEAGVMINFVRVEDRVSFEINQEATAAAPLWISSRLLSLGRPLARGY